MNDTAIVVRDPVTLSEVVAAGAQTAFESIGHAIMEYERCKAENAELRGVVAALNRENQWLRGMIDKVIK